MKYSFIFGLVIILVVFSISNVSSIFSLTEDSIELNATGIPYTSLGEGEDSYITKMDLKFSNPNSVCQSTKCIVEIPNDNVWFSAPTGTENHITFSGDLFIRDEANNDLTPKKKDLVETWNIYDQNYVSDIVENVSSNEIIYYFDGTLSFNNDFKKLEEEYKMKGFYKLPERILQINGTR